MKWLYFIVLIFLSAGHIIAFRAFSLSNPLEPSKPVDLTSVATGVKTEVESLIKLEDVCGVSLQDFMTWEEQAVIEMMDKLCSFLLTAGLVNYLMPSDIESISLTLYAPDGKFTYNLGNADMLMKSSAFDDKYETILVVTGFLESSGKDYVAALADAYNRQGGFNFVVFNVAEIYATFYDYAVTNIEAIGDALSSCFLEKMPTAKITVIGHSVGVQVLKYSANFYTQRTGQKLALIVGLDPVYACPNQGTHLIGLRSGDAEVVVIIYTTHSGQAYFSGDWIFNVKVPQTLKSDCTMFGCSYFMVYNYITESTWSGYEHSFMGSRFPDGIKYPMGLLVDYHENHDKWGNYSVLVNADSPYGQNFKEMNTPPCH